MKNNIHKDIRVAEVLSASQIVLNIGAIQDVEKGDEFIIYGLSNKEINDPATGESLGFLELFRGVGVVAYLQDTMCILNAIPNGMFGRLGMVASGDIAGTFNHPQIGDFAKPNATKVQ